MEKFWQVYCQLQQEDELGDVPHRLNLGEKPESHIPVIASFKFKYALNEVEGEQLTTSFKANIIYCFQQVMLETLNISENQEELVCCVLEAEHDHIEDGHFYDHLRIQFPYCRIEPTILRRTIYPKVISLLRIENVISKLSCQPINSWDDIIDQMVGENAWPMYGSTTSINHPRMNLTAVWPRISRSWLNESNPSIPDLDVGRVFNPMNHSHVHSRIITAKTFDISVDPTYWLPIYLSLTFWSGITHSKAESTELIKTTPTIKSDYELKREYGDFDMAQDLLLLLSNDRWRQKHFWLDIGRAIFSSCEGQEAGFELWVSKSEELSPFTREDCECEWMEFLTYNSITVKTLAFYARRDSTAAYKQWHKNWCLSALSDALNITHTDVARALYRSYWLEYACSNLSKKTWYKFGKHGWIKMDGGDSIRRTCSDSFMRLFEEMRIDVSNQTLSTSDQAKKNVLEEMIKQMGKLIKNLKNVTFKSCLVTEAMEFFKDDNFEKYANENPNLLGIMNGVIETCDTYAIRRDGKPEDYVTLCSPIFWHDFEWNHPKVKAFTKWMHQIFTDEGEYHYILRMFASFLRSKNTNKIWPILTGVGDNSKSMFKKLIESVFGPYSFTFKSNVFTVKDRNPGGPTPELAGARYAKIAWGQEPDENDSIIGGKIKEMTGQDSIFARNCNENGGNFEPMFTLVTMCNKVPSITDSSKAIKNRARIVPFRSVWVEDAPDNEEEQFKLRRFKRIDDFSSQIPRMASAALWVFAQYYAEYKKKGLEEPAIIKEYTNKFWEDNDIYYLFTMECIEYVIKPGSVTVENPKGERDSSVVLSIGDVYNEFKVWYKSYSPNNPIPNRDAVQYQLNQRWGTAKNNKWGGIKLIDKVATEFSAAVF